MVPGENMLGARRRGFGGALTHDCCGQRAGEMRGETVRFRVSLLQGLSLS